MPMENMMRNDNYVRRLKARKSMESATQLNDVVTGALLQHYMTVVKGY